MVEFLKELKKPAKSHKPKVEKDCASQKFVRYYFGNIRYNINRA